MDFVLSLIENAWGSYIFVECISFFKYVYRDIFRYIRQEI